MEQIAIGDRVLLRSGSQRMMVNDRRGMPDGRHVVDCAWYEDGRVHRETFDERAVRKVDADEKPAGATSATFARMR